MSVVAISIANKQYRIGCEDGQEARLNELGRGLNERAAEILDKIGPMSESMLLATLCIVLADEAASGGDLQDILDKVLEIKRKLK